MNLLSIFVEKFHKTVSNISNILGILNISDVLGILDKCSNNLLLNYFYIHEKCLNYIDTFIPKNTIEIKQILLHLSNSSEITPIDITFHLPNNFNYPDLTTIIKDSQFSDKLSKLDPKYGCLEVIYYWQEHIYRIVFKSNEKIVFPHYSNEDLIKCQDNTNYNNGVLFATYLDQDITHLIKAYAGPKGNFYKDIDIQVNLELLKAPITYRGFTIKDGTPLTITNNYAEDYVFHDTDIIEIDNKN
jgi:hypothetical protein